MMLARPLAIASSLLLATCGDSDTTADTSAPDTDATSDEVSLDVDAETSPLCCPIAAEPSCDCFEIGGSGDNGCYAICDAIPVGWTRSIDENGCPIWTGGQPGSCLPSWDVEVTDTETSDDTSPPDTSDTTPSDTPDGDVGPQPEDPLGLRFTLAGSIQIIETYSSGAGEVVSSFIHVDLRDAPAPLPYVARAEDGACKVWTLADAPCDPPCDFGRICDASATCRPFPEPVSAGGLAFDGLVTPIVAMPAAFGAYTFTPEPPHDGLFAPGAAITVAAEGSADLARFTAGVTGVADLAIEGTGLVELVDGQPTTLTWTPSGDDALVEVVLQLGWHGAPATGVIVCRAPDSAGEIVITPDVIASFPYFTFGLFQAPSWIERLTRTLIPTDGGPLEITASSRVNLGVTHAE